MTHQDGETEDDVPHPSLHGALHRGFEVLLGKVGMIKSLEQQLLDPTVPVVETV